MNVLSRLVVPGMLLAGACVEPVLDPAAERASSATQALTIPEEISERSLGDTTDAVAATCGVSPSSIAYWATEAARDVFDENGLIGGCDIDAACLPTCWGSTSPWTSWSLPLIECPCPAP